jgi:hypothetical protein
MSNPVFCILGSIWFLTVFNFSSSHWYGVIISLFEFAFSWSQTMLPIISCGCCLQILCGKRMLLLFAYFLIGFFLTVEF